MSIFHRHKHEIVAVKHESINPVLPVGMSTIALFRCPCGDLKTESLHGRWSLEQLRGDDPREPGCLRPDSAARLREV